MSAGISNEMPTADSMFASPVNIGQGANATMTGAGAEGNNGKQVISPTAQRVLSMTSSSNNLLEAKDPNDDAEEIRKRRRSHMMEKHQAACSPITPSDRRRSLAASSVLSNIQIAEHYAQCIQLSAENKITSKNAFGLHLIDYMSEQLKRNEMNDFQMASSTLDASAKIYAGRVDAIHAEAYKVLSGLGRAADQKEPRDDEPMDRDDEEPGPTKKAKQQRNRHKGRTIQTNLKAITLDKLDQAFEVDPLFQKMSAAFDGAGTDNLLLCQLHTLDDCTIVFDGTTEVNSDTHKRKDGTNVNAISLKDQLDEHDVKVLQICPAFRNFEFTNWNQEIDKPVYAGNSTHAFDIDQAPEPEVALDAPPEGPAAVFDGVNDLIMADDGNDADSVYSGSSSVIGDTEGRDMQIVDNVIDSIRHSSAMGSLMEVLSTEKSDYSYFKANVLKTWAGPGHWKIGYRAKEALRNESRPKKKKAAKDDFDYAYEDMKDFEDFFRETRKSTILTEKTIANYSRNRNSTLIPAVLDYKPDELFQLFGKPNVTIKRTDKKKDTADEIEERIGDYDYDNQNDRDNYCPGIEDDAGDDGDDNFEFQSQPLMDGDEGGAHGDGAGGDDQEGGPSSSQLGDQTIFSADNMVSQPWKAENIHINYAKTAKRVDVKKLKAAIWSILCKAPSDSEHAANTTAEKALAKDTTDMPPPSSAHVQGTHSFQSLITQLFKIVPQTMAQNLSVPIITVCLLHLANEKTLHIIHTETMGDLRISQG